MGFRIFASGAEGFHYEKDKCIDGSEFNTMKIIATLQNMERTALGVADAYISHKTPGITDLMVSIATQESLHNLKNAVSFLAMHPNVKAGWISVNATEKNMLWADTVRLSTYRFFPGDLPGSEFVKTISKTLEDTDMNNFGVLMQLAIVLSKFSNHISNSTKPIINISLTK